MGVCPAACAAIALLSPLIGLASLHVQVTASKLAVADDDGAGSQGGGSQAAGAEAAVARARGKLVSQLMKKHLVEGVVGGTWGVWSQEGMECVRGF